ncbi:MAG: proton-conducting transporter membrane subunit [Dissulfuribacterales bacterium]
MLELVFIFTALAGIFTLFLPRTISRIVLIAAGLIHLGITGIICFKGVPALWPDYFQTTPEGNIVLLVTSFLYLMVAIYTVSYMAETEMHNEPVFSACLLLFLAAMSMACVTDHIIVLWIAIEATTLMSAPLIFLHRSKEALEATWKYVLICSVGIALALLGVFFTLMAINSGDSNTSMTFHNLLKTAKGVELTWLKAGFIFTLIGYGTKMGLAPMHTWLPDAHSEAPSPVSALLSGALLNCAFLGILKTHSLLVASGMQWYSSQLLSWFGLFSILIAAVFMIQQDNYKRLLAYSSIENMGVIAFGIGIGGLAAYGAMLHLIHHALLKSSLFLSSGNMLLGFGTKKIRETGRMPRYMPRTFASFISGFAGISGFPPFGIFLSELFIIFGTLQQQAYLQAGIFLLSLALVFAGAAKAVIRISFGNFTGEILVQEKWRMVIPIYTLMATSVLLTVYLPQDIHDAITLAVNSIGGLIHG